MPGPIRTLWNAIGSVWIPEAFRDWGEATSDTVDGNSIGRFATGRWYHSAGPRASLTMVVNRAYASPFIVSHLTSFDRMVLHVTTEGDASSVARLGIYADDGGGVPDVLVFDGGTVDIDSTGAKEVVIDETLTPGVYWIVTVAQDSGTNPVVNGTTGQHQMVARTTSSGSTDMSGYRDNSSAITGAMPATFPTGSLDATNVVPRTQVRAT